MECGLLGRISLCARRGVEVASPSDSRLLVIRPASLARTAIVPDLHHMHALLLYGSRAICPLYHIALNLEHIPGDILRARQVHQVDLIFRGLKRPDHGHIFWSYTPAVSMAGEKRMSPISDLETFSEPASSTR